MLQNSDIFGSYDSPVEIVHTDIVSSDLENRMGTCQMILKKMIKIIIAGTISLVILSVFCIFYSYTGIHIKNTSGATDYKWSRNQFKSTMIEGFSWFRMDDNGFNNSITIQENPDILLMGSSHMEATEIGKEENAAYLLNQELPNMTTYNIGMSGHDIYRCANNLRNAVQEYNPNSYVIVETDTVGLDSEKIDLILRDEMEPIKSYDSGLMYMLQRYYPAIKTLYKQILDWRNADKITTNETIDNSINNVSYDDYVAFIRKMKEDSGDNVTLIIFYQPAYSIDSNGDLLFEENEDSVKFFSRACEANNVVFINMTERFRELYEHDNILAHGFSNTAVGVGHLNKYGHEAIAEVLFEYIEEDMP